MGRGPRGYGSTLSGVILYDFGPNSLDWTGRREHKVTKKLLVAKKSTCEKLARKMVSRLEAGQSLRGALFKAYRGNEQTSAKVGDDFEFMQMCKLDELDDIEPFDYVAILAPDPVRMEEAMQRLRIAHGEAGGTAPNQSAPQTPPSQSVVY